MAFRELPFEGISWCLGVLVVKKKAVFLDRDGTINIEKNYLHRVEDFEFILGAPEAIRRLRQAGFLIIVVTNQSGVARGMFGLPAVEKLHQHMQAELGKIGAAIDAFYICPHHPLEGQGDLRRDCDCRKGKPGLLLRAAADYDVDLSRSYMIGDKRADVEAGRAAGCEAILVLSGYGGGEAEKVPQDTPVFPTIVQAVEFILRKLEQERKTPD
jgi:D-glycero-D-manno-heptose 1,7-bisphosphate phosphatase